ncbi:hypothetical protein DNTS_004585 [Danionella cerebrum]|uniref:Uncharacterized protein n=1 Tax=Danionella cerebrum TaxID=2873325 RepID=A0A553Q6W8_9TELE|nr:hypothetical protein DNTS_004585 [Danionella translucida]
MRIVRDHRLDGVSSAAQRKPAVYSVLNRWVRGSPHRDNYTSKDCVVTVTAVRSNAGFGDGRLIWFDRCSWTSSWATVSFSSNWCSGSVSLILIAVIVWTFTWGVCLGIDPRPVGAPAAWPYIMRFNNHTTTEWGQAQHPGQQPESTEQHPGGQINAINIFRT